MDMETKKLKSKVVHQITKLEKSYQNDRVISKVKKQDSSEGVAYALLDAGMTEIFVDQFLMLGISYLFEDWAKYDNERVVTKYKNLYADHEGAFLEATQDMSQEQKEEFEKIYNKEKKDFEQEEKDELARKKLTHDALRDEVLHYVRIHAEKTAKRIEELQNYLELIQMIKF